MVKPLPGPRQPGGPFIRAALLMTLINEPPWELQGQDQGVVFYIISIFNVAKTHWSNSALDPTLQLDFSLAFPKLLLCRNVPKSVCGAGWECLYCCFLCLCHW